MESMKRKPVPTPIVQSIEQSKEAEVDNQVAQQDYETSSHGRLEETPALHAQSQQTIKQRFDAEIDRLLPPHRMYCGLSRCLACLVVIAIVLVLLALILGLAIGLSLRNRSQHLALPLGSQTYTGDLTYYGTGLGACGVVAHDTDDIVSISHYTFDAMSTSANPNANPLCGHKIRAVRDGNSIDLTVVDRCTGCRPTDIDVSPGAFKKLADPDLGRVTVTWAWLPPVPST